VAVKLQEQALSVLKESDREDFLRKLALVADRCREAADNSPTPRTVKKNS